MAVMVVMGMISMRVLPGAVAAAVPVDVLLVAHREQADCMVAAAVVQVSAAAVAPGPVAQASFW